MLSVFGNKLSMSHSLGQKAKSVASKVAKVAIPVAKGLGVTVASLGAIGAVAGFDRPPVKTVRSRGGLERAIRGGNN